MSAEAEKALFWSLTKWQPFTDKTHNIPFLPDLIDCVDVIGEKRSLEAFHCLFLRCFFNFLVYPTDVRFHFSLLFRLDPVKLLGVLGVSVRSSYSKYGLKSPDGWEWWWMIPGNINFRQLVLCKITKLNISLSTHSCEYLEADMLKTGLQVYITT